MAMKSFTLAASVEYESPSDPAFGTPDATKFTLGMVDVFAKSYMYDRSIAFSPGKDGSTERQLRLSEMNLETVRFGLKGWANFEDSNGNDLVFKTSQRVVLGNEFAVVSDENLRQLGADLIRELALEICKINEVTVAEAKKSEGVS